MMKRLNRMEKADQRATQVTGNLKKRRIMINQSENGELVNDDFLRLAFKKLMHLPIPIPNAWQIMEFKQVQVNYV